MWVSIAKVALSASTIAFASWLAGKRPGIAGFIIAMPLASLLALAFNYVQFRDTAASIDFAKSILIGVPISYLFFAPFFVAERFHLSFWTTYISGLGLLVIGFFLHRWITSFF